MVDGYLRSAFPEGLDVSGLMSDGLSLVTGPEFWAAHFLGQCFEDEEMVFGTLGVEGSLVSQKYAELTSPDEWPSFRVPLGEGNVLLVLYRNLPEDGGVDYVLMPAAEADICLSSLEGHFRGPGLSWPELEAIVSAQKERQTWAQYLLLLAPMYADADQQERAIGRFAEALQVVGSAIDPLPLAEALVREHLMWGPPVWAPGPLGSRVCDGEYSPRNPISPYSLGENELQVVSQIIPA